MSSTTHDSSIPQPQPSPPQRQQQQHPPYAPTTASLGGLPTINTDIPITAVFLFLFLLGAVTHMTILQVNRKRGHKFLLSGMLFGFCMARLSTCALRIAWAVHPTHLPLAIAANIFVSAGVILLLVINLIFAQRILRATHPHLGWHRAFNHALTAVYVLIVITLIMLITVTIQSFYTLSRTTRRIDRAIQLYGGTCFALVALLPIVMVIIGLVIPRTSGSRVENFGIGRFRTKIGILLTAAVLLTLGATFRIGTNYLPPRQRDNPAWYHSKPCFYVFNLLVEILVVLLYAVARVDRRFHVPDGSSKPGDYSGVNQKKGGDGVMGARIGIEEEEEDYDRHVVDEVDVEKDARRIDHQAMYGNE